MKVNKILITGGHPTPALAVIDYVQASFPDVRLVFVGRRHANPQEKMDSFEYQEVLGRKIPFVNFAAERGIRGVVELPQRFLQALSMLRDEKPDVVLSFGGYLSVPVCFTAFVLGIPIYLHEQTLCPGIANEWIGKIAQKIMVSFPQAGASFDPKKTIMTGNPIRNTILDVRELGKFGTLQKPVLFVNGGNLGSHSINTHIFALLPQLTQRFSIIHQLGNIQEYGDWQKATRAQSKLPPELRDRYVIQKHLTSDEMGKAFACADIVVSRSGANTTMELIALRKPAVLIPLPWSARNEQRAQAELLSEAGAALIFDQYGDSAQLLMHIQTVYEHVQSYIDHYESLHTLYQPKAAEHIAKTILSDTSPS